MLDKVVIEVPEQVPKRSGGFYRCLGRMVLALLGWRVRGEMPNISKAVFAAAPHTSNWDFVLAMFASLATGVKISYLMKKEAFFWPLSGLFKALGGIPIDRAAAVDTVAQIAASFNAHQRLWLVITPEGTRAKVASWKTGFLRAAAAAKVPVVLIAWDYPSKSIVIDKRVELSGDHHQDIMQIRQYIDERYTGRHPQNQ